MVAVDAAPASADDPQALDLQALACPAIILETPTGREHVLIGDGAAQIRLDVRRGTLLDGPARLRFNLLGAAALDPKLSTLHRLSALIHRRRFPRPPTGQTRQAQRWMTALRALDARRAGAPHREVAAALFGANRVAADWTGSSAYLRCRVQRAIKFGDALVLGGYRRLLT